MRSKRSSSRAVLARRSAAGRCSRRPIRSRSSWPVSQLSTAENCPVTPIAARTAPASPRRSCPRTLAVPASAGIRVDRTFTVVVLPAPFGPSSAKTSPSPMLRSTPSRTTFSPYAFTQAARGNRGACLVLGRCVHATHAQTPTRGQGQAFVATFLEATHDARTEQGHFTYLTPASPQPAPQTVTRSPCVGGPRRPTAILVSCR